MSDSFLLAVAARAEDCLAGCPPAAAAAASLEALPEALLLEIISQLPLHARVRAQRIARWYWRELPRAAELWTDLVFEPGYASETIHDGELEALLRRVDAVSVTRALSVRACGPGGVQRPLPHPGPCESSSHLPLRRLHSDGWGAASFGGLSGARGD
jgi:hypothetical protein